MKKFLLSAALFTIVAVMLAGALPATSYAQSGGGTGATGGTGGGGTGAVDTNVGPQSSINTPEAVQGVLQRITNWMFTFFIAIAAMMIIYAAFVYLTSGGGEEVQKAHKMLLYAAVAIVVATMSRGIVTLVKNFVK